MKRVDIAEDVAQRVKFIRQTVQNAQVNGIVFGNSGGKDSALVGILCKMACENSVGVIMPCGSMQNYNQDREDAETLAEQYGIETRVVELTQTREALASVIGATTQISSAALNNIAPRLRMTTLYAIAGGENRLVAGTGNRSEGYMGYFTKWGDGAYDFNPISDLTVTEIYDYLRFLGAPQVIIEKAPSAGLFDGQTDEDEMGVSYQDIDDYLCEGREIEESHRQIIETYHTRSIHKRKLPLVYKQP